MAGGAPSVWRAVSVTILVLLASSGRVKVRLDDALAISAVVLSSINPLSCFNQDFNCLIWQLFHSSILSGILAKAKTAIGVSFLVTSISQLSLYPVLLFHFYELSISSFVVNLVYVPLYSIIILPANIVLLFMTSVVAEVG